MKGLSLEIRAIDVIEQMIADGWHMVSFTGFSAVPTSQVHEIRWIREEPKP